MFFKFAFFFSPGKLRLAKWYATLPAKTKNAIIRDVTQLVMSRRPKMCNVLEYKGTSSSFHAFIIFQNKKTKQAQGYDMARDFQLN
jgi:hypothetical protein